MKNQISYVHHMLIIVKQAGNNRSLRSHRPTAILQSQSHFLPTLHGKCSLAVDYHQRAASIERCFRSNPLQFIVDYSCHLTIPAVQLEFLHNCFSQPSAITRRKCLRPSPHGANWDGPACSCSSLNLPPIISDSSSCLDPGRKWISSIHVLSGCTHNRVFQSPYKKSQFQTTIVTMPTFFPCVTIPKERNWVKRQVCSTIIRGPNHPVKFWLKINKEIVNKLEVQPVHHLVQV